MTFGTLRIAALEYWKKLADPCNQGLFIELPDSGAEAPLVWQMFSYPISCQWQVRAGSAGFGHISIFCSIWEWAANLTDTLLDHRFDDYPIGELDSDAKAELDDEVAMFSEHAPEILSRHYFRTIMLAAETLEDLTILRNAMSDDPLVKKNARNDLSQSPLGVDTLIGYANRICKHKGGLHECNHHILKLFLDSVESFDSQHYTRWNFLREDRIEIPRYEDLIQTVIGAFRKIDELLADPDHMARVGAAFAKPHCDSSTPPASGDPVQATGFPLSE